MLPLKFKLNLRLPASNVRAVQRDAKSVPQKGGSVPGCQMLQYRVFLNSDEGHAFVDVNSEDLTIADCSRTVNLDMGVWADTPEELRANLKLREDKLNRILKAVRVASDNLLMSYNRRLREIEASQAREAAERAKKVRENYQRRLLGQPEIA